MPTFPARFNKASATRSGFIAMVIGLGTVIGKLLAESGGAVVVSRMLVAALGEKRLDWAMLLSGFLIGLPVFFQVGLVLLAPVLFTAMRQTGTPLLRLGIPLVAGLSVAHGFVPPHPGPLAAIERLERGHRAHALLFAHRRPARRDDGGPVLWPIHQPAGGRGSRRGRRSAERRRRPRPHPPSLAVTLLTILLPVLLMLLAALAQATLADGPLRHWIAFAGSPLVAMLLAALLALYTFGTACGFDRARLLQFTDESMPAVAGVLLVVGAGGGFGRVLDAAGVDTAIAQSMSGLRLSPLVLGWVDRRAAPRLSVGSATVACVTAASIMAPIVAAMPGANRDLLVVAIGAGSLIASHVNDGGFWLVKEYFNMSVPQTVATWTVLETIVSILGLVAVLLLLGVVVALLPDPLNR